MKRCPVVIFCYNRLDCLEKMVESLLRCNHVQERDYFFFSDAPNYKVLNDESKVELVRDYLYSLQKGRVFKSMRIDCATDHLGCRSSVIKGISEIINRFGKVIDIEDILTKYPNIKKIAINGGKAKALFDKYLLPLVINKVEVIYLPSTSPANARMGEKDLGDAYSVLID